MKIEITTVSEDRCRFMLVDGHFVGEKEYCTNSPMMKEFIENAWTMVRHAL